MHISRLALDHFRSWEHCVIDFSPGVTILQGANGMGKTNLVEAIEVLSTGSSHRVSSALPLVERGERKATVRANVVTGVTDESGDAEESDSDTTTYEVSIAARGANRGRINGGKSLYMREIVGQVPSVSFTPEDQRLISGDPASRRGFLDQAGAFFSPEYAVRLQQFTKIARQRVALLKQLSERENGTDASQAALSGLEAWTGQFIEQGVALTRLRAGLVDRLAGPFARIYDELAGAGRESGNAGNGAGHAGLRYVPSFDEVLNFEIPEPEISRHFQRLYAGEVARGRNLIGPHRDDLEFTLDGSPAREFASNGEMWTMALALKMALYGQIAESRGVKPIVILDDVFAQLDETRRAQILDFAARQDQVLITVAAASDIPEMAQRSEGCAIIDVAELKRAMDRFALPLVAGASSVGAADAADAHANVDESSGSGRHSAKAAHAPDEQTNPAASVSKDEGDTENRQVSHDGAGDSRSRLYSDDAGATTDRVTDNPDESGKSA